MKSQEQHNDSQFRLLSGTLNDNVSTKKIQNALSSSSFFPNMSKNEYEKKWGSPQKNK